MGSHGNARRRLRPIGDTSRQKSTVKRFHFPFCEHKSWEIIVTTLLPVGAPFVTIMSRLAMLLSGHS